MFGFEDMKISLTQSSFTIYYFHLEIFCWEKKKEKKKLNKRNPFQIFFETFIFDRVHGSWLTIDIELNIFKQVRRADVY